jgi:hypothetical protein
MKKTGVKVLASCIVMIMLLVFSSCATLVKKVAFLNVVEDEQVIRKDADKIAEQKDKAAEASRTYTVLKGDSLWSISGKICGTGVYWPALAKINGIKEPYSIRDTQKLLIDNMCPPAPVTGPAKVTNSAAAKFEFRTVPNKAFGVGERLVFAVKYFNVTAGFGILEVKGIEDMNGRKAYHIDATARTAPFFETFYRVKDVISSYMDVFGLFSWKYAKHLEEGGYRNDTSMVFNHEKGFAEKNNGEKCDITPFVQDVLSEFYYFRSAYKGDEETRIDVASDECKSYQIVVKRLRYEKVTTDAGEFDCVVVQPFLKYEGIFKQKGDVYIWLTNDKNLMPVLVKSQIAIGTIDAVLQEATEVKAE